MTIYILLNILWLIFILYWIVSAFSAKKTIRTSWASYVVRILIVLALISFSNPGTFDGWRGYGPASNSLAVQLVGLLCAAAGIGLAIWARAYLGRNWGMPMSIKENPELVTTGPYAYIRHPIYTGALLAMIGSILIVGMEWIVICVIFFLYSLYSAVKEEKIMGREFPNQYPEYKKKTKMFVPFLF